MSKYTYGRSADAAVDAYSLGITRCCCNGLGYVQATIWDEDLQKRVVPPLGHPLFGKAIPCICKRQEAAKAQADRMREMSGVTSDQLMEHSFEAFDPKLAIPAPGMPDTQIQHMRRHLEAAQRQCEAFADSPSGKWLIIVGPVGAGKTHLAMAITGRALAKGQQATFAACRTC